LHGIFLSQSLLTSQSLRAAIGPLQFSLRHWNLRNLTLHSGVLPYEHASRSLEIFSANTVLSHGSIMLPPHQPRVFARLARWQSLKRKWTQGGGAAFSLPPGESMNASFPHQKQSFIYFSCVKSE